MSHHNEMEVRFLSLPENEAAPADTEKAEAEAKTESPAEKE